MMMASKYIFLAVCAALAGTSEATAFLKATPEHMKEVVSAEDVQASLLSEIEGSLGAGIASKRITDMKAAIGPMFASLPKNEHGNLDHVSVRYALHRAFVQRHGWSISGLDPLGASWNASLSNGILKDQVPAYIESLFEKRMGGHGLGLHEVALFGATVEHLIHKEAIGRLGSALKIHSISPMDLITRDQVDEVLETYMMAFILSENMANMSGRQAWLLKRKMPEYFQQWEDTKVFIRNVRDEITNAVGKPTEAKLDFATVVRVVETISERFGKFQDEECKTIKSTLMKMEDRGSGRVRLAEFYRPVLNGENWQLAESVAYLRELGVIDDSSPDEPRVMIANYITAQTNCIASSDFYHVCCIDECEDLLGHLEKEIAMPEATPERIAGLISALPSSSVSAPRSLSATLRNRLDDIAAHHGGLVQFHGRLFAQWMHHAYPRECPFPHMSDTTSQWREDKGSTSAFRQGNTDASQEELLHHVSKANSTEYAEFGTMHEDIHDLMLWTHEEELFIPRGHRHPPSSFLAGVRNLIVLGVVAVALAGPLRKALAVGDSKDKCEKFMV